MTRNIESEAIVLRSEVSGDIHRRLTLFSPELGIFYGTAFGALKETSKLASALGLFSCTKLRLYFNPVNKSYKITEAELLNDFPNIRKELGKYYSACLVSEIIQKSYGGGHDWDVFYELFKQGLEILDSGRGETFSVISQFILNYLRLLGLNLRVDKCGKCGKAFSEKEGVYYISERNNFFCETCASSRIFFLSPGARKYVEYTSTLDFKKSVLIGLDFKSINELKAVLYYIIQHTIETELTTLNTAGGLL